MICVRCVLFFLLVANCWSIPVNLKLEKGRADFKWITLPWGAYQSFGELFPTLAEKSKWNFSRIILPEVFAAEMHATRTGPAPEAAAVRVAQIEALVMQFESQLEELVLHESAATWGKSWDEASMIVDVGVKLPLHESTDAAANFNVRAPTSKLHSTTFS